MELIYLWVEKYKNIEKQGFNFSPRFECKFHYEYEKDEEGGEKLKDCKLEIKPKEHIKNFFDKEDKINVTAIVGGNGSGKSSILELIMKYIQSNKFFTGKGSNSLLVFEEKGKIYFKHTALNLEVISDLDYLSTKGVEKSDDFFFLHYDNSFSYIKENIDYQTNLIVAPNRIYDEEKQIITFNENEDKKNIIRYLIDKKHHKTYGKYFEPNKIFIDGKYEEFNLTTNKQICKNFEQIRKGLKSNFDKFKFQLLLYGCEIIKEDSHEDDYEFLLKKDTLNKLEDFVKNFSLIPNEKEIRTARLNKIYNYLNLLTRYAIEMNEILIEEKDDNIFMYSNEEKFVSHFIVNIQEIKYEKHVELLSTLPPCFSLNIQDDDLKYEDLSSGEKSILRIRFYIEEIIPKNKNNIFFILLDEPANDMHPDWQKKLLNYLIEMFKDRKQKFHFIITTHSPFLISDLPQENIIFLEDGKQVNGINKQTFGANIHTLLSDSFFMKDGLMGEFAKGKIMQIKKFHQKVLEHKDNEKLKHYKYYYKTIQEEFEQIQSIIGEPFLKTIVKNQLEEIETILFKDKAKQLAIQRFIREFGKDAIISEVMSDDKD